MADKSRSKLFCNKLFCITVASDKSDADSTVVSRDDTKKMVEELGGKVCSTVHKKVDFLVASETAVAAATQRVRKADKLCVPIVRTSYVSDCFESRKIPADISKYFHSNVEECIRAHKETSRDNCSRLDDAELKDSKEKKKRKAEASTDTDPYVIPELTSNMKFQCSCICHDRGEAGCSWCVDAHNEQDTASAIEGDTEGKDNIDGESGDEKKVSKKKKKKRKNE